jgi:hypothetical protein
MKDLADVLSASNGPEPPARDIEGCMTQKFLRCMPDMHAFDDGNDADAP